MYTLNGKEVSYDKFFRRSREFTPAQVAEAARAAIENWDWESADYDGRPTAELKGILSGWTADFVAESFADDDGLVRLSKGFGDIWDWLEEFAISSYDNSK